MSSKAFWIFCFLQRKSTKQVELVQIRNPTPQHPPPRIQPAASLHFTHKSLCSMSNPVVLPGIYVGDFSYKMFYLHPNILLASLCNTPSYVDIKARTDTYVGFLPSHALERLLDKRPIVLLTLAKRLISLLSPLSRSSILCFR